MEKEPWRFSEDATECRAHFLHTGNSGGPVNICFIYPDGSFVWKWYKNYKTGIKKGQAFVAKYNAE